MRQRGDGLGFALEARQPVGVIRKRGRQDLDCDIAIEARVPRPVDLAHAAGADGGEDFVRAETSAGSEGQVADYRDRTAVRTR